MSQTISINMPEPVLERFNRMAKGAKRPVEELLVNALTHFAPKPPKGLSEEMVRELEKMEDFSDAELWEVFLETMEAKDVPAAYSIGDAGDRLMLRKAYAGVLLQWRGHELPGMDQ